MYNYLIQDAHFAADHVKLLVNENATRGSILSTIGKKWLGRLANPDDLVVIYFSTHGSQLDQSTADVNYLIAYDTDQQDLMTSGIAMQDLSRIIKASVHSDRIVFFLDACHSGTVSPEGKAIGGHGGNINADMVVQGTGQLVIASSKPDQISWEEKKPGTNSVFTKYLLEGLRLHGASTKLGEAYAVMKDRVQEEVLREHAVLQTPVMKSKWQGNELVLAVPPTQRRPGLQEEDTTPSAIPSFTLSSSAPAVPKTVAAVVPPIVPVQPAPIAAAVPSVAPPAVHYPNRFALLDSAPPIKWRIETPKSQEDLLNEGDLPGMAKILSSTLSEKLRSQFGQSVVAAGAQIPTRAYASTPNPSTCASLGKYLQSRYIIRIMIDYFQFDMNVLTGNSYKMTVSGAIFDASTGEPIFALKEHTIKETTWIKDQVIGWRAYCNEQLVPHVAKYVFENLRPVIETRTKSR
jgi:hypothetical protein